MTWEHLKPGSSPVDWCEGNYLISQDIAEFVNTISNILFLLGPPLLIYLFKDYGKHIHPAIHIIWILLIIVGLSSAYFHATLSLLGQLLDELTILWVFMVTLSFFCPRRYFPKIFKYSRKRFCFGMAVISVLGTGLSLLYPAINAFVLMLLAIPAMYLTYCELKRVKDHRVYRLGVRTATILVAAIICWVNDRMFCDVWHTLHFPYLHGFWHILIFLASYTTCVLFAYFFVSDEKPESLPELRYWPVNEFELGIPYIYVCCYKKMSDNI